MLPPAVVVAGPHRRVSLSAGVGRAGEDKRSLPGEVALEGFGGGTAHVVAVHVVISFQRPRSLAVGADGDVRGRGEIGADLEVSGEVSRFVHVVPDPGHPVSKQRLVEIRPPAARSPTGEVGERRGSGPDLPLVDLSGGATAKMIAGEPAAVDVVLRVELHARVQDRHDSHPQVREILRETSWGGEAFGIPGEHPIPVHVVDVEVDRVAGNLLAPEGLGNLPHPCVGVVAVTTLLETQRPCGRQRHAAGQCGVALDDAGDLVGDDDVEIELRAFRGHAPGVGPRRADVEPRSRRFIEKHAHHPLPVGADDKRHGDVERISGRQMGRLVGVPHPVDPPALVEETGLLT